MSKTHQEHDDAEFGPTQHPRLRQAVDPDGQHEQPDCPRRADSSRAAARTSSARRTSRLSRLSGVRLESFGPSLNMRRKASHSTRSTENDEDELRRDHRRDDESDSSSSVTRPGAFRISGNIRSSVPNHGDTSDVEEETIEFFSESDVRNTTGIVTTNGNTAEAMEQARPNGTSTNITQPSHDPAIEIEAHLVAPNAPETGADNESQQVTPIIRQLRQEVQNFSRALQESSQNKNISGRQTVVIDGSIVSEHEGDETTGRCCSMQKSKLCTLLAFILLLVGSVTALLVVLLNNTSSNGSTSEYETNRGNQGGTVVTTPPTKPPVDKGAPTPPQTNFPTMAPTQPLFKSVHLLASQILPNALDEGNPTSIQFRSLLWLVNDDPRDLTQPFLNDLQSTSQYTSYGATHDSPEAILLEARRVELLDRFVIVCLYFAMLGEIWTTKHGWLSEDSVCDWYGVSCSAQLVAPPDISYNVTDSELNEDVDATMESVVSRVTFVVLSQNNLESSIPSEIGLLSDHLSFFQISENNLLGTLPTELGQLTSLEYFHAVLNDFSGKIPTEFGNCEKLLQLGLGRNNLIGPLPSELGNLAFLTDLSVDRNQLSGPLPSELGRATSLQRMDLWENGFISSVPLEW
eukprot:CAMPEP_0119563384 /NCGR_PEP_ID=MMETSP1352-20130426/23186_1 /TAXON_ID=265584 /ORGANISM="Stauroneis constricta, Strain CCMP1120" /LENGTH=631 /DNA_ID=CAMNT_0007611965 /DNA_START=61 /DNA_END=1953 /DNA_ORIENTATION=+